MSSKQSWLHKSPQCSNNKHIALLRPALTKHPGAKSVERHKDGIMASVLFKLIPMGNKEQREQMYRSGDLYL